MQHDPRTAVLDMLQAARRAVAFVEGIELQSFLADERTRWAVYSQIIVLGEAAKRIPAQWQEQHPGIPWSQAAGMRNRLVHGYDDIVWEIVWETTHRDLPELIAALDSLFPPDSGLP